MQETHEFESTLAVLQERIASIAGEVARTLALPPPAALDELAGCPRWITTGVGASEGAARLLARLLRRVGLSAEFSPISAFVGEPPAADVCVIVTQGLSPNATIPLGRRASYAHSLLITTRTPEASSTVAAAAAGGTVVITHGPTEEDGLLLRVVGPACGSAAVVALSLAIARARKIPAADLAWAERLGEVPDAIARGADRARAALGAVDPRVLFDVVGLVASGEDVMLCDAFRSKLLEGLGRGHPPLWDICSVVHGPLQSFYDRRASIVVLERAASPHAQLTARLARVLNPERHRLIRLVSDLPGPLALFDWGAQLDHLLLAALRAAPRDLANWPAKDHDAPLYRLSDDSL